MQILNVPHCKQLSETSCGVAAFEMVYRYFNPSKLSKFSQAKVFAKLQELTPDGTTTRVSTDAIVGLATARKLFAGWGRVSPQDSRLVQQVRFCIEGEKVPLIACQQWHKEPQLGHFRVIIGIDETEVAFHDPETKAGENCRMPLAEFIKQWRIYPGKNVTGGVTIWIADRAVKSPLDPDLPNAWANP